MLQLAIVWAVLPTLMYFPVWEFIYAREDCRLIYILNIKLYFKNCVSNL